MFEHTDCPFNMITEYYSAGAASVSVATAVESPSAGATLLLLFLLQQLQE